MVLSPLSSMRRAVTAPTPWILRTESGTSTLARLGAADDGEAARLLQVGGELGEELVAGQPDRDGDADLALDAGGNHRQRLGGRRGFGAVVVGQVEVGLIQRQRLNDGRGGAEDGADLLADALVLGHVGRKHGGVRAQLERLEHRHGGVRRRTCARHSRRSRRRRGRRSGRRSAARWPARAGRASRPRRRRHRNRCGRCRGRAARRGRWCASRRSLRRRRPALGGSRSNRGKGRASWHDGHTVALRCSDAQRLRASRRRGWRRCSLCICRP